MELNHANLCEIGAKFLRRSESANGHGCHFVIKEAACYGENPDVFGVRHGLGRTGEGTYLLEAKTSRSDFLADRKKPHRINPETGVGKYRYYICPTGLIKPEELPPKWGLIYVNSRGHIDVRQGVLGVPKQRYEGWGGKVSYFRPSHAIEENAKLYAFEERNTQNEINLLTMALARLDDPEQVLYMQRAFTKIQAQRDELERELNRYKRKERLESMSKGLEKLTESLKSSENSI